MKKKDLSIARIKNTKFSELYERFLLKKNLTSSDYLKVLSIAVIFINSHIDTTRKLGYRIIVIYCNQTHDYKPLYEIALNMGFMPISKSIESMEKYIFYENFFIEMNSAFLELFHENTIYKSEL